MDTAAMSALDRPAAELTVMDVYDLAAVLGREFERLIDRFGCESVVGVVPTVVRVLELLEKLVSRGAAGREAEELRGELDRLRRERSDRHEQERRHQQELEQVEDVWRGEVQDLLSQIAQLQAENKKLLVSLSLSESPVTEEDLQKQQGMSEKERQVMERLRGLVDKQRDEIRAKDHELTVRNEDVEALQMQQHRLIRMNQDLRHRVAVLEAQGKALIQQRVELEAAAQARQQELVALQLQAARLRKELRDWELEREVAEIEETFPSRAGRLLSSSPQMKMPAATPANSIRTCSVWVECGGDPGFMASCFEDDGSPPAPARSPGGEKGEEAGDREEGDREEGAAAPLPETSADAEPAEESDSLGQESDTPRFTLQELRDVLQERNELKAQVFMLEEELAYYKSEDFEDDLSPVACDLRPQAHSASSDEPQSGISRLIFTAIMPMVAAGLIADDPTLLPIRRLVSSV